MATIQHSVLSGANIHEPKGADTALLGQKYVADGAGSGDWTHDWIPITKLTTTSRASTTSLAADPDLVIPLINARTYLVRGVIVFTAAATPDLKYDWDYSSNVAAAEGYNAIYSASHGPAASTPFVIRFQSQGDSEADQAISGNDTTTYGWIVVGFTIDTHATNSTNLSFRWAQNTSNATATTVRRGSYLEYKRIA